MKKQKRNQKMIPTVMFHSDWFECRKCGNRELRRVQGDMLLFTADFDNQTIFYIAHPVRCAINLHKNIGLIL